MKYDIILTMLNSKYVHSALAPWCLFSYLKKCDDKISAKVYESTINADDEEIIKEILELDSKIYGFSCYIWNIKKTLSVAKEIKKQKPDCFILLGGPEVSFCCEEIFSKEIYIDFIISGEGEEPLLNFITEFNGNRNFDRIEGLSTPGKINKPYTSNKEYTSPYCDEYFESLNKKIAYIETSRGCPYRCAFCLSSRCSDVKFFSKDRIFEEIAKIASSGIKTLKFVDRTFNADAKRANEIFEFIINHSSYAFPADVCFHFEIAGDILKESTFEILKKAPLGLIQFEIGLQTFNEETLNAINRKTNIDKLVKNIKRLSELKNIHMHIDLIAGLPCEDYSSFKNTFNRAYSLKADMLQLGFLKLLHGAPLREEKDKYQCAFSQEPPYEVISTPYISAEELGEIKICEDALERLYNSSRFLNTLDFVFDNSHIAPYDFFYKFGSYISESDTGISLDRYTELFFEFLVQKCGFDKMVIRDLLSLDRLVSNKSGKLPQFLKIQDEEYGKIKRYISKDNNINFVILYSQKTIAFVDKREKTLKNGNFVPTFKNKDEFISEISLSQE